MKAIDIPILIELPFGEDAGAPYIRVVPVASQIGIDDGAASYTDGFPPLTTTPTGAGGIPPDIRDFNGLLNQMSAGIRWQQAGGFPVYDAGYSTDIGGYPEGAILLRLNQTGFWISTIDDNTSDPDTGGSNWVAFPTPSAVRGAHSGLKIVTAGVSNHSSIITAAAVCLGSLDGQYETKQAVNVTCDLSASGANGLDTGSLLASTFYYLYVISNGTLVASLASLSATAPTMPAGYYLKARVGTAVTDSSGSKYSLPTLQFDNHVSLIPTSGSNLTTYPTILSGGSATSVTAVPIATVVPPTAESVEIELGVAGTTSAAAFVFPSPSSPSATSAALFSAITNGVLGSNSQGRVPIVNYASGIGYRTTSGGSPNAQILVTGWDENL